MVRVKRGLVVKRRHKKLLKMANGYYSARSRCIKSAIQSIFKAKQYAYRDRKRKKRLFKSLWIIRLNSIVRLYGITYSCFINGISKMNFSINRKILSYIAFKEKNMFYNIVKIVQASIVK